MNQYPHNFITNHIDAKYVNICSKCGLGLNKDNTPTANGYNTIYGKVPPCEYEGLPTNIIINENNINS